MRLLVGLGNPGARYRDTPHNVGFQVCDRLAERHRLGAPARKFDGDFWRGRVAGEDVGILKPETYMNLSGRSVAEAIRYLPVEGADLIVVMDDMDLPLGRIRVRPHGGDGGHRGLRSIIECLGTSGFPRVRVGVGRPPEGRGATGHLLGRTGPEARDRLREAVGRAIGAVETLITRGVEAAMNDYNAPPSDPQEEDKA